MAMDTFGTLRIKKETVVRFQTFSRMYYKTHSEAMAGMLDFFKYNEISPHENLGKRMGLVMEFLQNFREFMAKRNNATIAIIKDLEKHGVLPTKAMMELLFEGGPGPTAGENPEDLIIPEIQATDFDTEYALLEERKQRKLLEQELVRTRAQFQKLFLDRVKPVRSPLGPSRLQLEITPSEFETLKQQFKTQDLCTSP